MVDETLQEGKAAESENRKTIRIGSEITVLNLEGSSVVMQIDPYSVCAGRIISQPSEELALANGGTVLLEEILEIRPKIWSIDEIVAGLQRGVYGRYMTATIASGLKADLEIESHKSLNIA